MYNMTALHHAISVLQENMAQEEIHALVVTKVIIILLQETCTAMFVSMENIALHNLHPAVACVLLASIAHKLDKSPLPLVYFAELACIVPKMGHLCAVIAKQEHIALWHPHPIAVYVFQASLIH